MEKLQRNKNGTLLYTTGIIVNIFIALLMFTGAYFVTEVGNDNVKDISDLSKEKGMVLVEKFFDTFSGSDDEVRKDDPKIVAQQNLYDARKYDLELSFNVKQKTIQGTCYMTYAALNDTLSTIYVNLYENMQVGAVQFVNIMKLGNTYQDVREIPDYEYVQFTRTDDHLIITLDKGLIAMNGDLCVLKISYGGEPLQKGFDSFSFKEIYDNMYIYTLSEPNYGPVWWPSKDLPDDKAELNMHLNVPTGWKGVSNGLLKDTVPNTDGTTTFNWESKYPIATYLVSIVVGNLTYWEDTYTSRDGTKQMPVVFYAFPKDSAKARTDWQPTVDQIRYFSETYGEYPFIDEKYGICEFGWTSGAMEHQTITSYGYLLVTGDNRYDNIAAHELAHHWFGDAVTLATWKDIWLNEGFASYSEALWEEHVRGKNAYLKYMKDFDYGYFTGTVYAPKGFIDNFAIYATIYQKGAWVLHMLRGVMGDEQFFKAIRLYYERYMYKNADTYQLKEAFEEVYGSSLTWFFDQWVFKGTGRPSYEYSWKFEDFQGQKGSGKYTVRLNLEQVQKDDIEIYKMPVKVTVVTDAGEKEFSVFNDKRKQSILLTVDSSPKEVFIDREGWILKKVAKGTYEKNDDNKDKDE